MCEVDIMDELKGAPPQASQDGAPAAITLNGVRVAMVEDDALASGGIGIFVGGDYNEVALDHFSIQLPD